LSLNFSEGEVKMIQEEWLEGRVSLGAAAGWTAEEMRILADIGYSLAEQGRNEEAITIFEGLSALAPVTAYFQAALGALNLRMGKLDKALSHLNAAIASDPNDASAFANRGELFMLLGNNAAAIADFRVVESLINSEPLEKPPSFAIRAKALMNRLQGFS
jgi:tetratricopeptide (TPR) repeat protein